MNKKDALMLTIFATAGIVLIYNIMLISSINDIKAELLKDVPNELSNDFKFMKDFADRNIEVYTLTTGLFVTAITFIIGFVFKFAFDRRVAEVERKHLDFVKKQDRIEVERRNEHSQLKYDSLLQNGNLFSIIGHTSIIQDVRILCGIWAISFWFKSAEENNEDGLLEHAEKNLKTLSQSIEGSLSEEYFHRGSDKAANALIDSAPREMLPLAAKVANLYLAEVERIRKL